MFNRFRQISGRYLYRSLEANFYKVALDGGAKSTVDSLRRPMLANFLIAFPNQTEQDAILKHIEKSLDNCDRMIEDCEIAIERLQERRTALISAAVTGKIDVRNHAPTSEGVPA
jgi:type I restriction enzyme S subunit